MKNNIFSRYFLALCLSFFLVVSYPTKSRELSDVVVVVNETVDREYITRYELFMIYTFKVKKWWGGEKITVVQMPIDSSQHRQFITGVLKMGLSYYHSILNARQPVYITAKSKEDMYTKVSTIPNSVGYISNSFIYNRNGSIKVAKLLTR